MRTVEDQIERLDHFRLQLVILVRQREHHVQEVRRVFVFGLRIIDGQPARLAIGERGDRADLGNQARHLKREMSFAVRFQQFGVETPGGVDHRGQDGHGMRRGRKALEMVLHVFVKQFVLRERVGKPFQLRAVRQPAPDQQQGDFDERGFLRQLLDGNAAVTQNPFFTVDERDGAFARTGVAVAVVERDAAGFAAQLRDVNATFLFGSFNDRELNRLSVQF
jgi:hypothetical protein